MKKLFAAIALIALILPAPTISADEDTDFPDLPISIYGTVTNGTAGQTIQAYAGSVATENLLDTLTTTEVDGEIWHGRNSSNGEMLTLNEFTGNLILTVTEAQTITVSTIEKHDDSDSECPPADAITFFSDLKCRYDITLDTDISLPTAITDLSATGSSSSQITLNWTANTDSIFSSYKIYRSTSSGVDENDTLVTTITTQSTTSYTNTSLSTGTYYYTIYVVNDNGSTPSNEVSATVTYTSSGGSSTTSSSGTTSSSSSTSSTTSTTSSTSSTRTFLDVPTDAWYATHVYSLAADGIVSGQNNSDYFAPALNLNRAEAAKVLSLACGVDPVTPSTDPFPDVSSSAWFAPYIYALKIADIVDGYLSGLFGPSDNVLRSEFSKILARACGLHDNQFDPTTTTNNTCSDLPQTEWYTSDMNRLLELGILSGYSDDTCQPNNPINRAEMAKMIDLAKTLKDSQ